MSARDDLREAVAGAVGPLARRGDELVAALGAGRRVAAAVGGAPALTPPVLGRGGKLPPVGPIVDRIRHRVAEAEAARRFVILVAWALRAEP